MIAADLDTERMLLGLLMADNRVYSVVRGMSPDLFAFPLHAVVFQEIDRTIQAGELADAVTLLPRLMEHSVGSDSLAWRHTLAECLASCPEPDAYPEAAARATDRLAALWYVRRQS